MNPPPNCTATFLSEADELLSAIESGALSLSRGHVSDDAVNQIFRSFHTLKGTGSMCGFHELADFAHHVETLLDQVREGLVPVSVPLAELILASTDKIRSILHASQGGKPINQAAKQALLQRVHELSVHPASPRPLAKTFMNTGIQQEQPARVWQIRFRPDPSILLHGGNPVLLFRDLRKLGQCVVQGHLDRLPGLADLQPETCYLYWTVTLTSDASPDSANPESINMDAIKDVFVFVEDGSELCIEELSPPAPHSATPAEAAPPDVHKSHPPSHPEKQGQHVKEATVRVPAARLDRLVHLIGELVMNHSRLSAAASKVDSPELSGSVEAIERLVSELRDDVLQIRMMPIGSIFGRFRRLVHDLCRQLGKEVDLVTAGEGTELDKSILDQLGEPLVHLLRNSMDHGIETADDRIAKGKRRRGTIHLTAIHQGSDVVVSIEDDGKGLDKGAIRAKAVAKQLISADASLTDKEIFGLILLPGFSTAAVVSDVSGRGVGMDVVKRQIDALRGSLNIASEPGHGTTISMTLPLTLAIIEGLLVECGRSQYIIPMSLVTETVELDCSERIQGSRRSLISVRGDAVPYIDLRSVFRLDDTPPELSMVVLVRHEEQRIGFVVDSIVGTHQTVIQSLGKFFRKINFVSGCTIMGNGQVALILDVAGLVDLASEHKHAAA